MHAVPTQCKNFPTVSHEGGRSTANSLTQVGQHSPGGFGRFLGGLPVQYPAAQSCGERTCKGKCTGRGQREQSAQGRSGLGGVLPNVETLRTLTCCPAGAPRICLTSHPAGVSTTQGPVVQSPWPLVQWVSTCLFREDAASRTMPRPPPPGDLREQVPNSGPGCMVGPVAAHAAQHGRRQCGAKGGGARCLVMDPPSLLLRVPPSACALSHAVRLSGGVPTTPRIVVAEASAQGRSRR